ncbi:hypothetical protein QBC41DRAFT_148747 [Cercophora samala]|uniref:Uncharacterized protein n=1 Tax=Cercophora samala TaxID=330535 RepID=A0AA40DAC4_9PEZI|nr:hypothetical protein QBC41DRAFT_148747 [Cercophora samala]
MTCDMSGRFLLFQGNMWYLSEGGVGYIIPIVQFLDWNGFRAPTPVLRSFAFLLLLVAALATEFSSCIVYVVGNIGDTAMRASQTRGYCTCFRLLRMLLMGNLPA